MKYASLYMTFFFNNNFTMVLEMKYKLDIKV
jgi:hypothetical protein